MNLTRELDRIINRPTGWAVLHRSVYSNFDHDLDESVAADLLAGDAFAQHAAENFCGYIWHAEGVWFETVWQWNQPVRSYSSTDLADLIATVNEEWGTE